MKKLAIVLCAAASMLIGGQQIMAQDAPFNGVNTQISKPEGGRFKILIDGDYNVGTANNAIASITTNYHFTPHWMVGVGAGAQFFNGKYDFVNLPVFFYGRYYMNTDHIFRPYVDCRLGYSIGFNEHQSYGHLIANPTFGFSLKMSHMSAFNIGLGAYYGWDPHHALHGAVRNLISFNVRLGFEFGEY